MILMNIAISEGQESLEVSITLELVAEPIWAGP
jgi:hypothetical protein